MTFPNNTKNIKLYANEHGDPDLDDSTTFDSQEDAEWVTTLDKGGPMSFRSLLLSLTTATITLTAAAVGANPYYSNLNTTIPIFVGLHHAFVAAIFMDKIQIFEVGRITCKSPVLPCAGLRNRRVVLTMLVTMHLLALGSLGVSVMTFGRYHSGVDGVKRNLCWRKLEDKGNVLNFLFFDCWDDYSVLVQAWLHLMQAIILGAIFGSKVVELRRK
ncbi:hypothetical protein Moror_9820 [Moniliophthora roreri MCA 2997]|uniref:Uncharacterized protein n=2 Tax=Moniliophthora roreri TaxID=221103 RepID=V2Y4I3_MONRO|nr:hypothetical protein Moror_9820 [Moniliophthora roreri MCA 2997]